MLEPTAGQTDCCRSRDPAILSQCDAIIDVGGVYQPGNNRFDHHQRGFGEVFGFGFTTKLSSAGELADVGDTAATQYGFAP